MKCSNCGADLPDDSRFCAECGLPVVKPSETVVSSAASDTADNHETLIASDNKQTDTAPAEAEQPKSVYESVVGNIANDLENPISGQPVTESLPQEESVIPAETAEVITDAAPQTFEAAPAAEVQSAFTVPEENVPAAAPVTEPVTDAPAQPAPRKGGKKILLIAAIAAVLIVLGIVGFVVIRNFLPSASSSRFPATVSPLIISGEDEMLIYNGGSKPVTIDEGYSYSASSMDGKKYVFMVDEDDQGVGTIYYYDGSKAKEISDDVYSYDISSNGNVVGYVTDYDYEDSTGTFNIYDAASGKSKEVADDVMYSFFLSPDGKSYAYNSDIEAGDYGVVESYTSYISVNGKKAEPLDSGMQIVGLSNSANYVYYLEMDNYNDSDGKLYVRHGKTDTKIGSADIGKNIIFNQDYSEVMYSNNGNTYLSKEAGEKEKIADYPVSYMIVPDDTQVITVYSNFYGFVYNVKSLTKQMYAFYDYDTSEMMFGYLDGKGEFTERDTIYYYGAFQTMMADDGKGFYCLDDSGKIKYYKDVTDPDTKPVKIDGDDDITTFVVSPDQKTIYFIDTYETLWVKRGTADPVEVADDVMTNSLIFSADGKGVYFISDYDVDDMTYVQSGTLCYLSNAKNAKATEIEEEVTSVRVSDFGVVYYVFDEMNDDGYSYVGEAFYSKDGKKFESVMDEAIFG